MFELSFETTNDAFQGDTGPAMVATLLEGVASHILEGNVSAGTISDSSGNTVGSWALTEDYATVYQQALDAEGRGETAIAAKLYEKADDLRALEGDDHRQGREQHKQARGWEDVDPWAGDDGGPT